MTDDMSTSHGAAGDTGSASSTGSSDEPFWQEPAATTSGESREWVGQLQNMIEQLTSQATPVIREVGAKAAELAALAGEKAGPVAHRAAQLTSDAGLKLAERSRTFAAEIRRDQAARGEGGTAAADAAAAHAEAPSAEEPTTTGVS